LPSIKHLIFTLVTLVLLAASPAYAAQDFDQENPTPTPGDDFDQDNNPSDNRDQEILPEPEYHRGELDDRNPDRLMFDTCATTEQTEVCYVEERSEFWVSDDKEDGYSAIGWWYVDHNQNGSPDDGDRAGMCRNPHGNRTWAVCDMEFDSSGVPLYFMASAVDWDNSHGGRDGRTSEWEESET
jgi:hypothetical protein